MREKGSGNNKEEEKMNEKGGGINESERMQVRVKHQDMSRHERMER